MAEDAEVGSGTSSITRSAENLSVSVDMAEDAEVGGNGYSGDNETVERSPSKKPNGPTKYLTSLRSDADNAAFEKKRAHLIILTIVEAPSSRHHIKGYKTN